MGGPGSTKGLILLETRAFLGRPSKNNEECTKSWVGHGPGWPQHSSAPAPYARTRIVAMHFLVDENPSLTMQLVFGLK
jgi:hypothetical protein